MYSLDHIIQMNAPKPAKAEDAFSRHCSYVRSYQGVVLHSAKRRSTMFIAAGPEADRFLRLAAKNPVGFKRDRLIESYFA